MDNPVTILPERLMLHEADISVTDAGNRPQGRNLLKTLAFLP